MRPMDLDAIEARSDLKEEALHPKPISGASCGHPGCVGKGRHQPLELGSTQGPWATEELQTHTRKAET